MIHLEKSHKQLSQKSEGELDDFWQQEPLQAAGQWLQMCYSFMVWSSEGIIVSQSDLSYMQRW